MKTKPWNFYFMVQQKIILFSVLTFLLFVKVEKVTAQNSSIVMKPDTVLLSKKQQRKLRSKYIGVGLGRNRANFRDFATSPLTYYGRITHIGLSIIARDARNEVEQGTTYDFGTFSTSVNDNFTFSNFHRLTVFYDRLFRLGRLSTNKFNVKVGALLDGTGNLRINTALRNNAVGLEAFTTLFGSIKLTKDISRKTVVKKRFLFIKYQLKPKRRDLAFRLNVGLINGTYRNGYVYANQSAVLNNIDIFEDHEYKLFSGFRMGSRLDYTRYLKNKNAIQLSYVWDAYQTGGDLDKLEVANHIIKLILFFNTNNR